jgi:hypothetical protein
VIDDNMIKAS